MLATHMSFAASLQCLGKASKPRAGRDSVRTCDVRASARACVCVCMYVRYVRMYVRQHPGLQQAVIMSAPSAPHGVGVRHLVHQQAPYHALRSAARVKLRIRCWTSAA